MVLSASTFCLFFGFVLFGGGGVWLMKKEDCEPNMYSDLSSLGCCLSRIFESLHDGDQCWWPWTFPRSQDCLKEKISICIQDIWAFYLLFIHFKVGFFLCVFFFLLACLFFQTSDWESVNFKHLASHSIHSTQIFFSFFLERHDSSHFWADWIITFLSDIMYLQMSTKLQEIINIYIHSVCFLECTFL